MKKISHPFRAMFVAFALIVGLSLIASCGSMRTKSKQKYFKKSVQAYNDSLRWQRYGAAVSFVDEDKKDAFLLKYEAQREKLNITDFDLMSAEVDPDDPEKGTARLFISYFMYPSVDLKRELQVQQWRYDKDRQRWMIDLPDLKSKQKKSLSEKQAGKGKSGKSGSDRSDDAHDSEIDTFDQ